MNYVEVQTRNALAWKTHSSTLPTAARAAAPYVDKDGRQRRPPREVCLPADHAVLSLLPEVRELALDLFGELGIPWHAGVGAGPSNHLLSSQVQCVNALGQMVLEPDRIVRAFEGHLATQEILEIEPGRYLTFEYIGPDDLLAEQPGRTRTRGARCTSYDAAFKHRAGDGKLELVLVEWKFTESYLRLREPDPRRDATRTGRYKHLVEASDSPVAADVLPFEMLLDEPFYQLVRQQLFAHELEKAGAEGADRVRIVHVLAPQNTEYQNSLPRSEHRAAGGSVNEVWGRLLTRPDRFDHVDPHVFLDPL